MSRLAIAATGFVLAVGLVGWGLVRHEHARLAPLHQRMTFAELDAAYGWPLWTVCTNKDLDILASHLRFQPTPLAGECLGRSAIGGRSVAMPAELPPIRHPWSARPSGWYALLGGD
ncbi:MAG TPA: hypothetical protein VGL86_04880 [Polyangia bacterium]